MKPQRRVFDPVVYWPEAGQRLDMLDMLDIWGLMSRLTQSKLDDRVGCWKLVAGLGVSNKVARMKIDKKAMWIWM